jgi:hypothetical protein
MVEVWEEFGSGAKNVAVYTTTEVGRTAGEEARDASIIQVLLNSHAKCQKGSPFYINRGTRKD